MTDDLTARDGDGLERFFAAARSETPPLRTDVINAILADAAEQSHLRRTADQPPPRARTGFSFRSLFSGVGGWPVATAVTLCGLLGFVAGISGGGDIAQTLYWSDTGSVETTPDAIVDFIDLALAEG